jgi:CRISPR-associated protein Cas4
MEETIKISYLNDFVFCPMSIYFHNLYDNLNKDIYQTSSQINGTNCHKTIDEKKYSSRKDILQSIDIYCNEFNVEGKIDVFDIPTGILTERKRKITKIYDGYVFQLYAQYYALIEMGYNVNKIRLHSICDNKTYNLLLPEQNPKMNQKFKNIIKEMHKFDYRKFIQKDCKKCLECIYEPICDRSKKC